ncbi:Tigger transposable element-derived protein 6 [Dictyocoela muelleri]|nr:Tigger transposable element-derived protein 6 [Dictyocoela muelleri]
MTTKIFEKWIIRFNEKMLKENRKILLLLDNATCHSNKKFSNVELCFLPKNTTALIQPCDQGIIKSFKDSFTNLLTDQLISDIGSIESIDGCIKKTNILTVLCLTKIAWERVRPESIKKSFIKLFEFNEIKIITIKNMKLILKML